MITAVTSGQELTDLQRYYEDYYVYNIVHNNTTEAVEVSQQVFLRGPFLYRITVDRTGYYLLCANVLDENRVYNADTGKTRELTGYFILRDKRGKEIHTYHFSQFRETIITGGAIKRPIRYKVLMYLEKKKVYTGNLFLTSEKRSDKECILRLRPNKDIYQYDSSDKNVNTGSLPKAPRMEDGIITKIFEDDDAVSSYLDGYGKILTGAKRHEKISGFNCCLMWAIDESLVNDFSKPLPLTTTNIFYIDQSLGCWLYRQLTDMKNHKEYKEVLGNKIKNLVVGAGETAVSTIAPAMLVEGGIITAGAATPAGLIISVLFLFLHAIEDDRDALDRQVGLLYRYKKQNEEILSTPIALIFKTQRAILKRPRELYDPPGLGTEPEVLTANEFTIEAWDGAVTSALGESLKIGSFVFSHYSESGRDTFMDDVKREVSGS